jgi:hypothetical protein
MTWKEYIQDYDFSFWIPNGFIMEYTSQDIVNDCVSFENGIIRDLFQVKITDADIVQRFWLIYIRKGFDFYPDKVFFNKAEAEAYFKERMENYEEENYEE